MSAEVEGSGATDAAGQARQLLRSGQFKEAERAFADLLAQAPDHVEALNVVAMAALGRGERARCLELLARAARAQQRDVRTLHNLGVAHESAGDWAAALAAYDRAVRCDPQVPVVRLRRGLALEQLGRPHEAVLSYFGALRAAQQKGQWMNRATTAPGLQPLVEHAIQFTLKGQYAAFARVLEPARSRFGAAALARVDACLSVHLGQSPPAYTDPNQRPTFLFFPGLAPRPYFDAASFPWMAEYEAQTAVIREELRAVLPKAEGREAVFHDAGLEQANLRSDRGTPRWDGYYFYRHGGLNEVNARNAPRTFAAIEKLPLSRVPRNAPEVMFSVLEPGTHLLPHRGVTNTRLVSHLPLIVPQDCALVVGGKPHAWQEGRGVVFDDTYEHEAWNRSSETRVVLIADVWHPDLTEAEREGVSALVIAINDFRLDSEQPPAGAAP